ncbi:hypothetical protein [Aestuariicoccus sp. MJ-SS9]|uniref:hypothetical protein n=1 Tax=Aestuariicoccus sp. MJ-SS9 TaxID=3079855 RepID=UPI0029089C4C|nr:hypothetical protein [Aestuariicoccus sp. MJ-SS9]MDU8911751.1 hypothetical protein [Aestuariicoccus sp. MJ-SS9]
MAKVLRDSGAPQGAARVLTERDRRVLRATYDRRKAAMDGTLATGWPSFTASLRHRLVDAPFGWVFGYGHRPARALLWVVGIVLINWWLYFHTYENHQMAPDSDIVLTSKTWTDANTAHEEDPSAPLPLKVWQESPEYKDYETFHPLIYALDLFIPLDALGQEAAWSPSPARGVWGTAAYWSGWVMQLLGWVITAIGAAALAGLVGRKD